MPQINELSTANPIQASDLMILFSNANSDSRKATLGALTDFLETNLNLDDKKNSFTTQYSSPNIEAFNVIITDSSANTWSIITPTGAFTDMTITLPAIANAVDKQEILINCTQAITTLTIGANGATAVTGAPTALTANQSFRLKFDKPFLTWYAVG